MLKPMSKQVRCIDLIDMDWQLLETVEEEGPVWGERNIPFGILS